MGDTEKSPPPWERMLADEEAWEATHDREPVLVPREPTMSELADKLDEIAQQLEVTNTRLERLIRECARPAEWAREEEVGAETRK